MPVDPDHADAAADIGHHLHQLTVHTHNELTHLADVYGDASSEADTYGLRDYLRALSNACRELAKAAAIARALAAQEMIEP